MNLPDNSDLDCMTPLPCPLCNSAASDYFEDKHRRYHQCENCSLVFVAPCDIISRKQEKARYDLHQNSPDDKGYRNFLSRICTPIKDRVPIGAHGLDFGSGPGPALSIILEELGYSMELYDPFYAPDESVLLKEYDFVTATEVVEHFREPQKSLNKMWDCVKPGGYLGIMTKLVIDKNAFSTWHYITDETHICFFSKETFIWLCRLWKAKLEFVGNDIVIFHKA